MMTEEKKPEEKKDEYKCEKCDGTGKVEGERCTDSWCFGTGVVQGH